MTRNDEHGNRKSDAFVTFLGDEFMKKNSTKLTIFFGVICTLLVAVSSWYTITFNDSRFIVPMESQYHFRVQDLPMIVSGAFLALYILYLFILLVRAIIENKRKEMTAQSTRTINPKLGFLVFSVSLAL